MHVSCGLIRAPNYYSASDRHPERRAGRDRVLDADAGKQVLNEADVQDAKRAALKLGRTAVVEMKRRIRWTW